MPVPVPSTSGDDPGGPPEAGSLATRVAAGPGAWEGEEWLADLRRLDPDLHPASDLAALYGKRWIIPSPSSRQTSRKQT